MDKVQKIYEKSILEGGRPLNIIALDIYKDWKQVNYAAKPYLEAMRSLDRVTDTYMFDNGIEVVYRFLANASQWKGPVAKEIKKELKKLVK